MKVVFVFHEFGDKRYQRSFLCTLDWDGVNGLCNAADQRSHIKAQQVLVVNEDFFNQLHCVDTAIQVVVEEVDVFQDQV